MHLSAMANLYPANGYCIVKLWKIRTVGRLAEKLGEMKSICIGNVMEIVKRY